MRFYVIISILVGAKTYLETAVALLVEPKISLDQLIFEDGEEKLNWLKVIKSGSLDFEMRQDVTDETKKCLELF